jgi:hypothetical protein
VYSVTEVSEGTHRTLIFELPAKPETASCMMATDAAIVEINGLIEMKSAMMKHSTIELKYQEPEAPRYHILKYHIRP